MPEKPTPESIDLKVVLSKKLDNVIYNLMVRTVTDQVYQGEKTLTEILDDINKLLSGKATKEQVQEIWDRLNLFFADAPEDFQTIVDIFNYINTTKKDTDAKFEEYKKILDQKVPIETYTEDKKLFAKEIQKIKSTISKLESESVTNEVFNLKLTELEKKIREDMNRNILASSGPDVPEELIDGGFWIQTV